MKLLESGEMYLEAILILEKKQYEVRSIDISEYMNYSKPSVSRAVKKLRDDGFISVDINGIIRLTIKGREIAEKIYDRHITLSTFFEKIGVSKEVAVDDACKIEHDISDETIKAIKEYCSKL